MLRSSPGLASSQSPAQQKQQLSPSPESSRKSLQCTKSSARVGMQVIGNQQVGPLTAPITQTPQVITYKGEQEDPSGIGFGSARPVATHKSPNRSKWSPLVHTIAEAAESFTGAVFPVKLFDDVENGDACQSKTVDSYGMNNDGSYDTHGPLAPSLEPNVAARHENFKVEEEEEGEEVEEEDMIPMDLLLDEIQRLTAHEFGGPFKPALYPRVLEPLYQRLYDYHVCLKSARKRAGDNARSKPIANNTNSNGSISINNGNIHITDSAANSSAALNPNANDTSPAVSASEAAISKRILALEEKIIDLEKQLAQSRKAHHGLLQDHILNFTASTTISASCIALSHLTATATSTNTAGNLTRNDASAIKNIIASVPSVVAPSTRNAEAESSILTRSQLSLQDAIKAAKEKLQVRQPNDNSDSADHRSIKSQAPTTIDCKSNASLATLSLKDHPTLLNDATTRLLRAETELGLLKLVMAQNQQEISGLEDEVFRKQTELSYHRKVFENILELNQLGLETQIWEDQVQIKELMSHVKKLEQEREAIEETVKTLEAEIKALETRLGEKREARERQEPEMTGRAQDLEATIAQLRQELASQTSRVAEMEQLSLQAEEASKRDQKELESTKAKLQKALQAGEGDECMVDHLEKEHKKATMALRSNLVQVQKTNKRLDKELSALAMKIVRVENLNEELSEQAKQDRAEIKDLMQHADSLKAKLGDGSDSSLSPVLSMSHIEDTKAQNALKEQVTALETQVAELTSSLRLKETELEQAQEVTERLTLQLETDLEQQKQAHQEEMEKFAAEKKLQAQRERACQTASVTLFQNMVGKLQNELSETQEKLRDTTICWGNTKEQLQKREHSYRRSKKDLVETTQHLHEVEETVMKLGDAIGMLEAEKEANLALVRALEDRDREMRDMEYRLRVLEEERE
ncbi:hypothetical protein BGX27_006073 [Mortierella sp. AM989]|nr:hypothetical protein BGX27_006073 [Mortierella sp. AM989]